MRCDPFRSLGGIGGPLDGYAAWTGMIRGMPRHIRSDIRGESIAETIRWLEALTGTQILYVAPGSLWENPHAESFHARFRDELLNLECSRMCVRPRCWPER